MAEITLAAPVTKLKGVGEKLAEKLAKLGIIRIQDLLFHLPIRYQNKTQLTPVGSARPGQEYLIDVTIQLSQVVFGRRRSLLCHVTDGTGVMLLRFFHFSKSQQQQLVKGERIRCFGEVRSGPSALEMVHPEYQLIMDEQPVPIEQSLTAIYPTTEGLHQLSWRKLMTQALSLLTEQSLPELLPTLTTHPALNYQLTDALKLVHAPPVGTDVVLLVERHHPAQQRLAFEELVAQQLTMRQARQQIQQYQAPILQATQPLLEAFLNQLPFPLTAAQQRVIHEIQIDLAQQLPMQRLVQGDVGSGKTVVAAMSALTAVSAGYQAVVMAPTELLAEQHFQTFNQWFNPLGVTVGWCASKQTSRQRQQTLAELVSGQIQVVIGTHALFQQHVVFANLGLVIIDEQHRFGVQQRLALRDKGRDADNVPHQLVMTATPIPRTLAMTAYADLQLSVIDELPPGRQPITTIVVSDQRREEVIERVHVACQQQRQVYWVCTLIEESEHLQCQAAEETARDLQANLPDLRIGLVHGRMKAAEKETVMQAFKQAQLDLLVATTVIEVGVDVPNASLMIIENAERLGLAQLHQLRGRVGRGNLQSHCVLMYHAPLSENGLARLKCLRESQDGFVIAERDLEIRGPGEVLGTRQTGLPQFRIADLVADQALLPAVSEVAEQIAAYHPDNADALVLRWFSQKTELSQV